jgi:FG-GAP-like repeat
MSCLRARRATRGAAIALLYLESVTVFAQSGPQDGLLYPGNRHQGSFPHEPQLIDTDADGDLDLVFLEPTANHLVVRRNQGFGTFGYQVEHIVILSAILPDRLAAGDFDADGDTDLALVGAGNLLSRLNGTLGSFLPLLDFPIGGAMSNNRDIAAGDVVAGGEEESVVIVDQLVGADEAVVVTGTTLGQSLLLSNITGANFPCVCDVDSDGDGDLMLGDTVGRRVLRSTGTGVFLGPAVNVGELVAVPTDLAIGQLNGDAFMDLVVPMAGTTQVGLFLSTGAGTWSLQQPALLGAPGRAALMATLGGQRTALVAEHDANRLDLLRMVGVAPQLAAALNVGRGPHGLASGDIDGDGRADLALAHTGVVAPLFEDGDVWLLHGNAAGTFPVPVRLGALGGPRAVVAADLDNDGDVDLAALSGDGTLGVNEGYGNGNFKAAASQPLGPGGTALAAEDMDLDGDVDLVAARSPLALAPSVTLLLNDGNSSYTPQVSVPVALVGPCNSLAIGRVNGDAFPDVVAALSTPGGFALLLGVAGGGLGDPTFFSMGAGTNDVALGDLSGDGLLDVASADSLGLGVSWRAGLGDGTFGTIKSIPATSNARALGLGDADRDGDLDIVSASSASTFVTLSLNDGNATFTTQSFAAGTSPSAVAIADVNGDTHPDLVTVNEDHHDMGVMLSDGAGSFGWPQYFATGRLPVSLALADFDDDGNTDLACADPDSNTLTVLINQSHWTDIGLALPGQHGPPLLTGSGPLLPGATITATLTNARKFTTATLVAGLSLISASFKGGVMGPAPDMLIVGFNTGPTGEIAVSSTWVSGLPSGFNLWMQWWIADPFTPFGVAASNTLRGTVP